MNIQAVFDTGILSYNIGNEIIMDSVMKQLDSLFPNDFIVRLPIEDIGRETRKYNSISKNTFVGGTNALNGDLRHYHQWDLNLHNALILNNIILLGCGWFQYETRRPTRYTRGVFDRVLSKSYLHSVRDNYTLHKCESLKLKDVKFINTGCPTLWELTPEHVAGIPSNKSGSVVFTLTDYNRDPKRDGKMVDQLLKSYDKVILFPQGTNDINYLYNLERNKDIDIIRPRLKEFDSILETGIDYVGTRLHAGIRALQHRCRSYIIGIDNRAIEMGRDFGLPVLATDIIGDLANITSMSYKLQLELPFSNIDRWKSQFVQ